MVSTPNVSAQHSPQAVGHGAVAKPSSETGGFDFMSYLLGLQTAPGENQPNEKALLSFGNSGHGPKQAAAELDVQSLLNKAHHAQLQGQWNPLFPGAVVMPQPHHPVNSQIGQTAVIQNQGPELSPLARFQMGKVKEGMQMPVPSSATPREVAMGRYSPASQPVGNQSVATTAAAPAVAHGVPVQAPLKAPNQVGAKSQHPALAENDKLSVGGDKRKDSKNDSLPSLGMLNNAPSTMTTSSTVAPQTLTEHSPHANTVPQMFSKVEAMIHQGGGRMTVSLTPPHLGQVEIQVTTRGKKVEIETRPENDMAKSVLESSLTDLKQSLHAKDLVLSKMDVQIARDVTPTTRDNGLPTFTGGGQSFQQGSQGQQFGQQFGSFSQSQGDRSSRDWNRTSSEPSIPSLSSARHSMPSSVRVAAASGGVDLRI